MAITNSTGLTASNNVQTFPFKAALVYISADTPGFEGAVGSVAWTAASYNKSYSPSDGGPVQRFWMGASFTFATTDVNVANNTITKTAHGWSTGECTAYFSSSGGLPGGMAVLTNYWVIVVDSSTIKLATSRANALAGIAVDITTQGTGTHTCNRGSALVVPSGVTEVRVTGNIRVETDDEGYLTALIAKNGATYYGMPEGYTFDYALNLCSSILEVSEGDVFHLNEEGGSVDGHTIDANEKATWMAMEVYKTSQGYLV